MSNITVYATPSALNQMAHNYYITGTKDNVPSFHWTEHLEQSHGDVQTLLQCQALSVLEDWHYTVFDPTLQTCYFGKFKSNKDYTIDDSTTRQVSANTYVLDGFRSDTFVTRSSNLYYKFTYVRYYAPKNTNHCSVQCYFDAEDKCDFFFVVHFYCYLGNFNQPSYAYHLTDTVTTYIHKGNLRDSTYNVQ